MNRCVTASAAARQQSIRLRLRGQCALASAASLTSAPDARRTFMAQPRVGQCSQDLTSLPPSLPLTFWAVLAARGISGDCDHWGFLQAVFRWSVCAGWASCHLPAEKLHTKFWSFKVCTLNCETVQRIVKILLGQSTRQSYLTQTVSDKQFLPKKKKEKDALNCTVFIMVLNWNECKSFLF